MKIGYIRVSKHEQNEALQRDALREAGCEKYFNDTMTGAKFERKGLEKLLAFLAFIRPGDTVAVWKLDRLGRSLKDLIETLDLVFTCARRLSTQLTCDKTTSSSSSFGELRRLVGGVSETMLIQELKEMVADNITIRQDFKEVPPKVVYSLTEGGMALAEACKPLCTLGAEIANREGLTIGSFELSMER